MLNNKNIVNMWEGLNDDYDDESYKEDYIDVSTIELIKLTKQCENQKEYDELIDKYLLKDTEGYNTKNTNEYSFLTAQQMRYRTKQTIPLDTEVMDYILNTTPNKKKS